MNLRTQSSSYISRMYKVPIGSRCIHTGLTSCNGAHIPSKSTQDKGIFFEHFGHHALLQDGSEVIFAGNDLVEVLR